MNLWNFSFHLIYKKAIDYAKEKGYKEIVETLSIKMEEDENKQANEKQFNSFSDELINFMNTERQNYEKELQKMKDKLNKMEESKSKSKKVDKIEDTDSLISEINKLKKLNIQAEDEINRLRSYLLALKKESPDIKFYELNDFKEETIIGKGATSSVKIVSKTEKYAKKELNDFTHQNVKRFIGEGEILFKLRHPCIIRIHGFNFGNEKLPPSLILSLEPKSLETAINKKELDNNQKNLIIVEIVLGMRFIHSKNFMHRDLKPSNILLSKNLHAKISDFGLARNENLESSLSKGVGTLRFMAPELLEETDEAISYTNKIDVYSFGITLVFIITNEYSKFSIKNVVAGVKPNLPKTIIPWVKNLIENCLALSPNDRPSFSEIFEIIKKHNFDMFSDNKSTNLSRKQQNMKQIIESRILKIEAIEYQYKDD